MGKKDTFVVRSGTSGSYVKLPSGQRVHTLNRDLFNRAVGIANAYMNDKSAMQRQQHQDKQPQQHSGDRDRPATRRGPA
jgi:hypothetical protein